MKRARIVEHHQRILVEVVFPPVHIPSQLSEQPSECSQSDFYSSSGDATSIYLALYKPFGLEKLHNFDATTP